MVAKVKGPDYKNIIGKRLQRYTSISLPKRKQHADATCFDLKPYKCKILECELNFIPNKVIAFQLKKINLYDE